MDEELVSIPITVAKDLVEYLYHDEEKDYQESGCPEDHIFCAIEQLKNAIEARRYQNGTIY